MSRPLVAMTPWRLDVATFMHPVTDLFTLGASYTGAIERAGGDVAVLTWGQPGDAARRLSRFDALVLTGGPDIDPALYGAENHGSIDIRRDGDLSDAAFVRAAVALGKPVLGICRGQQVVNVALGGTLTQHVWGTSPHHPERPETPDETHNAEAFLANRHPVDLAPGSLIRRMAGVDRIEVNSLHHQAVDRLGEGLRATGVALDGVIEAIEHDSYPILTVQWHPERLDDVLSRSLFDWLVDTA